jgi:hypothetical protein
VAVTDFANDAAAVAAGYASIVLDRGATANNMTNRPRFQRLYQKSMVNLSASGPDGPDTIDCAEGESNVDQATADAKALAALNAWRRHRYGGAPGRASGEANSLDEYGHTLTVDTN